MLEIKAPLRFEEIEKTIQAIEKKKTLKQRLFEEEIKKLETKKDAILTGEGQKKESKKNLNEIDEESFPSL